MQQLLHYAIAITLCNSYSRWTKRSNTSIAELRKRRTPRPPISMLMGRLPGAGCLICLVPPQALSADASTLRLGVWGATVCDEVFDLLVHLQYSLVLTSLALLLLGRHSLATVASCFSLGKSPFALLDHRCWLSASSSVCMHSSHSTNQQADQGFWNI